MNGLRSFFTSEHFAAIHYATLPENEHLSSLQIGRNLEILNSDSDDWGLSDIVLIGCGEQRGHQQDMNVSRAPDAVRAALYKMYNWHGDVQIADAGNLLQGATLQDSRAALRTVLEDLHEAGKIAILIGGSQDLTLQQYQAFRKKEQTIDVAVMDMLIDLNEGEHTDDTNYLMELLTGPSNYIRNYSHIAFQSYYVNPTLLETLDKLRFDCYRLGRVRENLEDMEPVLRSCSMLSVDMNVLRFSEAPFLKNASPNGLFGDELCQLMRYAGMSQQMCSAGIYGYIPENDPQGIGAAQIAQMIWYFIDGYRLRKTESDWSQTENFRSFDLAFTGNKARFLQSKRSGRWWMQLMDGTYMPCSYQDFLSASNDQIPERWLREHERIV